MPGKRRDPPFGHDRASMQRQHSALMAKGSPHRPKKEDLDILLHRPGRRPNADSPARADFEIRHVLEPDERAFGGVLKNNPTRVFRYGGISRRDFDHDIDTLANAPRRWQAGERYVGTRMPATQYISVGGSQICLLQQNRNPLPTCDHQS